MTDAPYDAATPDAAPYGAGRGARIAALAALSAAAFVFVTSETLPVGLLPQIAGDLEVSEGQVGLLLTGYAVVAGATAIPFTAWTTQVPRHRLLLGVLAVFVVSQIAAGVATGYATLVAARVLCALAHGVFWSVLAPVAARLVRPGQEGRATAAVFAGNSLALVLGVPLGTLLGQLAGWRTTFLVVGVAGAVVLVALWRLLPPLPGADDAGFSRALFGRLVERRLVALYAVTAVGVIGQFAAYSYLAPLALDRGGFEGTGYGVLLLGYGAAGLVGILVAARVVDSRPRGAFAVIVGVIVLALVTLGLVQRNPVVAAVAIVVWGGTFTPLPVLLQGAVLRVAPAVSDVASAVYVVAFQIGIGGGAFLGGLLVDDGALDATVWTAAVAAAVALVIGLSARGLFPARARAR